MQTCEGMCLRRAACAAVMAQVEEQDPWFGIEQEYYILDPATKWPLGWSGYFDPQKFDIQHAAVQLTKQEASLFGLFSHICLLCVLTQGKREEVLPQEFLDWYGGCL